ncbi:hypothetical protein EIP91_003688 [Steccherinum ochraceum]|uniref:Uncharacterized protein n=1 Tax=Steccherinum ochraceum TaxID=92696 RepID=A0A4R0RBH1_9APHY|nr:hypothetical protein EIP91_003688 [Steccherinum ochraceum]
MADVVSQQTTGLPNGKTFLMEVSYASGEAAGVKFLVAVSVFSFLAVLGLLASIGLSAWNTRKSVNPYMFVRSHSCAYLVSMLVCDLLGVAIGSLMNSAWTKNMSVKFGTTCVAQGVIKHIADVGPAVWSLVIAMHTFWVLFLRLDASKKMFIATFAGGWTLVFILVLAGPAIVDVKNNGSFYGISGHWCWIADGYPVARIMTDYFWMFFSAITCFVLYGMILLKLRGNITTSGWKIKFSLHKSDDPESPDGSDHQLKVMAKQMLLYPIAYTIIILPIACCRFVEWSGKDVSWGGTVFSDSVYLMSGLVNVILFIFTRRVLPPHTVIKRRITLPNFAPVRLLSRRGSGDSDATAVESSTGPKAMSIDDDSIDLEKATYLEHGSPIEIEVRHDEEYEIYDDYMKDYQSDHGPLTPNPSTPAHQRHFNDIPLDTPAPGWGTPHLPPGLGHTLQAQEDEDESDYSNTPSTSGYPLSSPEEHDGRGLDRLSIRIPTPTSPREQEYEEYEEYDDEIPLTPRSRAVVLVPVQILQTTDMRSPGPLAPAQIPPQIMDMMLQGAPVPAQITETMDTTCLGALIQLVRTQDSDVAA